MAEDVAICATCLDPNKVDEIERNSKLEEECSYPEKISDTLPLSRNEEETTLC
jgi:hypothetical protein